MTFCVLSSALQSGRNQPAMFVSALISNLRLWFFVVAQVIEVKFEKLDLEPDTYCRYDYVALFNGGENDNSRRIGKFCGDRAPG